MTRIEFVIFVTIFCGMLTQRNEVHACPITIVTGPPDGFYESIFDRILPELQSETCPLKLQRSLGSHENLELLMQSGVTIGLVQGDTLHRFHRDDRGRDRRLHVLSSGYFELIYLLSRSSLQVESFRKLKGMRVWVGPDEGGSAGIAQELMDLFSIATREVQQVQTPQLRELENAFLDYTVDLALLVSAPNAPWLQRGIENKSFRFNNLSLSDMKILLDEDRDINGGLSHLLRVVQVTFTQRELDSKHMLSVPTYLVSNAPLDSDFAHKVVRAFKATLKDIQKESSTQLTLLGTRDPPLPRGTVRSRSYEQLDQDELDDSIRLNQLLAFTLLLGLSLLLSIRFSKQLRSFVLERTLVFSLMSIICLCLISTLGTYLAEHTINEDFSDLPNSFWSILIYLFSGLEDREPFTLMGKLFSIITMVTGPLIIAVFSGAVASTLIKNFIGKSMPAKLNDHYLIINVSLHLDCIIQELRSPLITTGRQGAEIVIVSPHHTQVETEIARLAEIHSELYFKEADTTKIESLRAVGAQSARSILILAPPNGDQLSPLRTLVTLKHLLLEHGVTVNTTVELTDPQSVVLIHELSQGYPGSLDYLAQGELNSLMLAQSILNPGLTGFYRDLMSISGDNNEAYMVELPSAAEDMSFVEYARLLLDQHRDYPYLLVGVKRPMNSGYRLICNPRAESELFTLKRGDFLILLSYDPPEKGTLPLSSSN